jgi:hypothetical protein
MRKVTISFMSVSPHGTARLPLDGFWWNLIFRLSSKICRWNSSFIKIWQEYWVLLHEDVFAFMTISRWIILRMRTVSSKSCRENQNTYFMFSNIFPEIVPFMRKYRKIWWESEKSQMTKWRIRVVCWISKATRPQAHARSNAPIPTHRTLSQPYCCLSIDMPRALQCLVQRICSP